MTYLTCCIWFIWFCDIVKGLYLFSSCQPIRFEFLLLMSGNLAWEHLEHKNYFAIHSIFARLSNSKRNREPCNCNSSGRIASWSLDKPFKCTFTSRELRFEVSDKTAKLLPNLIKYFIEFKSYVFILVGTLLWIIK